MVGVAPPTEVRPNTPEGWGERADAFANPWDAAGWGEASQPIRIGKALSMLAPKAGHSLLDFGCGPGVMAGMLAPWDEFGADGIAYTGYDWAPRMVARAHRDYPTRTFTSKYPTGHYDLVACVGVFNLRDNWSLEQTYSTLADLWGRCNVRLFASLYLGTDERCLVYEPGEVADWANANAGLWQLERWRHNDLALVLQR